MCFFISVHRRSTTNELKSQNGNYYFFRVELWFWQRLSSLRAFKCSWTWATLAQVIISLFFSHCVIQCHRSHFVCHFYAATVWDDNLRSTPFFYLRRTMMTDKMKMKRMNVMNSFETKIASWRYAGDGGGRGCRHRQPNRPSRRQHRCLFTTVKIDYLGKYLRAQRWANFSKVIKILSKYLCHYGTKK